MTDRAQLHHLADRARRGVLLPAEGALLADAVTELEKQLADQASGDEVARRAAQAIAAMGADVRAARAERDRYRLAWQSARNRVKRAQRNREAELRWANGMWSDALRDLDRYRKAWQSARHRAAMYLKSNQNLVTSLKNSHAARLYVARAALDQPQPPTEEAAPAVTVHACPGPDDNGISPCCRRPPFEFRGERITRDPANVTCPGPAQPPTA